MSTAERLHVEPEHLQPSQSLVVRADGTAEVLFVDAVRGREVRGTYRGCDWAAHEAHGEHEPNEIATALASSLGLTGVTLKGTVIFTGVPPALDVPGVVVRQAVRLVGELEVG